MSASNEIKLKPCPFCGESEIVETSERNDGLFIRKTSGHGWEFYSVECNNCGCHIGLSGYSAQEAVAAWNRRAAQ